jgi:hypothetical protein
MHRDTVLCRAALRWTTLPQHCSFCRWATTRDTEGFDHASLSPSLVVLAGHPGCWPPASHGWRGRRGRRCSPIGRSARGRRRRRHGLGGRTAARTQGLTYLAPLGRSFLLFFIHCGCCKVPDAGITACLHAHEMLPIPRWFSDRHANVERWICSFMEPGAVMKMRCFVRWSNSVWTSISVSRLL